MKQRYLGSSPFETADKDIFFGRTKETQEFVDLLKVEKLIILYAKSGMGKTSLINAGVIPKLDEEKRFIHWSIRLRGYIDADRSMQPQDTLRLALKKLPTPANFVGALAEKATDTTEKLWLHLKALQYEKATQEATQSSLVLFFDQFEELFTYPMAQQQAFKDTLAKLLQAPPPDLLKEAARNLTDKEQIALCYAPLDLKVVLIIRADRMSGLDTMKDHLPYVLHTTYEMKPLTRRQARQAIEEPAAKEGEFATQPFRYDLRTLEKILNYLSSTEQNGKVVSIPIESFQLQIICQLAEKKILSQATKSPAMVVPDDVGNLDTVFEQYYGEKVKETTTQAAEQLAVRKLIEEDLIMEGRRLSLDEVFCKKRLAPALLQNLVNSRLLRLEPNSTGGYSYEVSHDTLIDPIEKARKERHAKEQRQRIVKIVASGVVVLAVFVGIIAYVYGLYVSAEEAKQKAEAAQKEAINNLELFKIEEQKRKQDNINKLLTEASNFEKLGQKDIAILRLQIALSIDSTNQVIIKELKRIQQ